MREKGKEKDRPVTSFITALENYQSSGDGHLSPGTLVLHGTLEISGDFLEIADDHRPGHPTDQAIDP